MKKLTSTDIFGTDGLLSSLSLEGREKAYPLEEEKEKREEKEQSVVCA